MLRRAAIASPSLVKSTPRASTIPSMIREAPTPKSTPVLTSDRVSPAWAIGLLQAYDARRKSDELHSTQPFAEVIVGDACSMLRLRSNGPEVAQELWDGTWNAFIFVAVAHCDVTMSSMLEFRSGNATDPREPSLTLRGSTWMPSNPAAVSVDARYGLRSHASSSPLHGVEETVTS